MNKQHYENTRIDWNFVVAVGICLFIVGAVISYIFFGLPQVKGETIKIAGDSNANITLSQVIDNITRNTKYNVCESVEENLTHYTDCMLLWFNNT